MKALKVKELIEGLKECDPEHEVWIKSSAFDNQPCDGFIPLAPVKKKVILIWDMDAAKERMTHDEFKDKVEQVLNPRRWDKEMDYGWHRNLPNIQKSFSALRYAITRNEDDLVPGTHLIDGVFKEEK